MAYNRFEKRYILLTFIVWLLVCPLIVRANITFSHDSGTYSEDIEFTVTGLIDHQELLLSFIDETGVKGPWVYFDGKMKLTAVPSEKRVYQFKIQLIENFKSYLQKDFTIIITKGVVSLPKADQESGEYPGALSIKLDLQGNQNVYYKVSGALEQGETLWEGEAILLSGAENKSLEYTLEIFSKDAIGNQSQSVFYHYVITQKADYEAQLSILSPVEGTFANQQFLVIDNKNFKLIKYTTDGSEPESNGELYFSPVELSQSGSITLKVWALPRWTGYSAQTRSVEFTINDTQGDIALSLKEDTYYDNIEVEVGIGEGNGPFYYTLDDSSPDISSFSSTSKVGLTKDQNKGTDYFPLRVRQLMADDQLGPEFRFSYLIKEKAAFCLKYRSNDSGYRVLFANLPDDIKLFYTLDGHYPDVSTVLYSKSFEISAETVKNNNVTFRAGLWTEDNTLVEEALWLFPFSDKVDPAGVADDKEKTERIPSLSVKMPEVTKSGTIIKIPRTENTLYEISSGNMLPSDPDNQSPFLNSDIILTIPFGMEMTFNIKLSPYDLVDNRVYPANLYHFIIDKKPPENPVISNYDAERISNTSLEVRFLENSGKIYYKFSENGSVPQIDASNTTLYTEPIQLSGVSGKTIQYRLKALSADEFGNVAPSLYDYRFTIEKSQPSPPEEPLITPYGNSVEQKFQILWQNYPQNKIFYRIVDDAEDTSPFELYSQPVYIDIAQNPRQLRIEYYKENSLGNQSPIQIKDFSSVVKTNEPSFRYFIDSPIIYVASSAASQKAGTKDHPFTSLESACEYAQKNQIKTIFVAQGDYFLDKEIVINSKLEIFGGFDPVTWVREASSGTNVLGASDFPLHRYYFNLQEASLYLTAINVTNNLQRVSSLITGRSSYVRINDSQFKFSGIDQTAISMVGGKCEIVNSILISENVTFGSFISCERAALNIAGTSLLGKGNSDIFKAIVLKNSPEAVLRFVTLSPGKARESTAMDVDSSHLVISQSKIESGLGASQAIALRLRQSQLEINQSVIKTNPEAPYALGISAFSTIVNMQDILFEISAKAGATALALTKGESVISNSRFKAHRSSDYLYHIQLIEGFHQLYNNVFWSGATSGSIAVVLNKCNANIINNTFVTDDRPIINEAINILSGSDYRILNNIFSSRQPTKGQAIHLIGEQSGIFSIQNNCFSQWRILLLLDSFNSGQSPYGENSRKTEVSKIAELNAFDKEKSGGPIHNNITDDFNRIFKITKQEEYHLSSFSLCVNQGQKLDDFNIPQLNFDIDGEPRPSTIEISKAVDIGADEYYP
ncbi:MAG: chitobiase/beta-hexosaminidase C-terminal domain-containing protein [Spirochaetales bacterium]|nr:chitobiase/beta-hexosaminidase C-terminal domain-containing protein [Spirochaetales bacterium]